MKHPVQLFLMLLVCCSTQAEAQSNNFIIRLRSMQASSNLFDEDANNESFGLNLGYGKMMRGNRFGYDITVFGDWMKHNYYFDSNKRFEGATLYTGLAITPHYTFNPGSDVQFSAGVSFKAGYNQGYGSIKKRGDQNDDYNERLESKTVNGGYSVAVAPMISVGIPAGFGTMGLELGYDSSNYGQGINKLRSVYYPPLNYHSGYVFLGAFLRL